MEEKKVQVKLPEGTYNVSVQFFNSEDKKFLFGIYKDWRILCNKLTSIKSRSINLPEGLSEGVFCLAMDVVRFTESITSANTSFDCFNLQNNKRIQVKACSVLPDLTSFGPKSIWDEIYFVDFYRDGSWDGKVDIYLIDNNDIYNHKVNATQTLKQQQLQGRRPRFSIYSEIIEKKKLKPIKTFDLSK